MKRLMSMLLTVMMVVGSASIRAMKKEDQLVLPDPNKKKESFAKKPKLSDWGGLVMEVSETKSTDKKDDVGCGALLKYVDPTYQVREPKEDLLKLFECAHKLNSKELGGLFFVAQKTPGISDDTKKEIIKILVNKVLQEEAPSREISLYEFLVMFGSDYFNNSLKIKNAFKQKSDVRSNTDVDEMMGGIELDSRVKAEVLAADWRFVVIKWYCADFQYIRVHDVTTGKPLLSPPKTGEPLRDIQCQDTAFSVSHNGNYIALLHVEDKKVGVLKETVPAVEKSTGKEIYTKEEGPERVREAKVTVVESVTGKAIYTHVLSSKSVSAVISPDKSKNVLVCANSHLYLFIKGRSKVYVLNFKTKRARIIEFTCPIDELVASPDGSRLMGFASVGGLVRVFDVRKYEELCHFDQADFKNHQFSLDGKLIIRYRRLRTEVLSSDSGERQCFIDCDNSYSFKKTCYSFNDVRLSDDGERVIAALVPPRDFSKKCERPTNVYYYYSGGDGEYGDWKRNFYDAKTGELLKSDLFHSAKLEGDIHLCDGGYAVTPMNEKICVVRLVPKKATYEELFDRYLAEGLKSKR